MFFASEESLVCVSYQVDSVLVLVDDPVYLFLEISALIILAEKQQPATQRPAHGACRSLTECDDRSTPKVLERILSVLH